MNASARSTQPLLPKSKLHYLLQSFLTSSAMTVGGQAVIEGVMMRSPKAMTVALRKPDQKILVKEFKWKSLGDKWPILKKPFIRGAAMLIEAMINGTEALSFSAEVASKEEDKNQEGLSKVAIGTSIVVAFGVGLFMFVILPHLLTEWFGRLWWGGLGVDTFGFHLLDGLIKVIIFLGYVFGIGLMKDIHRVFQYHGAEHKSIYTFEKGLELSRENAEKQTRLHPRCGTAFILTAIMASILLFSTIFPLLPRPEGLPPIAVSLLYAFIKIPLMLPIMGASYEFLKLTSKDSCPLWLRKLSKPGLFLQYLTTREPDSDQLEVGLESLRACLWREENLGADLRTYER